MQPLRLRFLSSSARPDLPLDVGMHHVGHAGSALGVVEDDAESLACFCVDRRGVWLTVNNGARVHVNGRQVHRLAMLRVGDSVYLDGHEMRLVGERYAPPPAAGPPGPGPGGAPDPRVVLRGLGGRHHGRSFTLDVPRLVGRASSADIRIDNPAFADRHARLELAAGEVWLRDLGSEEGSLVNGERVHDALLRPGDQVVFDANDRFVVEAPMRDAPQEPLPIGDMGGGAGIAEPSGSTPPSYWRLPLVLLAALLIAMLLGLLLLYGAG